MKYSAVLLAAAFAAGVSAQVTRADFPACALPCLQDAIASETDCAVDDVACSCETANNAAIRAKATSCVATSCTDGADVLKTLDVSTKICAPGNNPGGEKPAESSSEAATSAAATSEAATSEAATSTASSSEAPSPTSEAPSEETSEKSEAPVVPAPTNNGTASPTGAPTNPSSPPFTGAATKIGASLSGFALAVAAFAL